MSRARSPKLPRRPQRRSSLSTRSLELQPGNNLLSRDDKMATASRAALFFLSTSSKSMLLLRRRHAQSSPRGCPTSCDPMVADRLVYLRRPLRRFFHRKEFRRKGGSPASRIQILIFFFFIFWPKTGSDEYERKRDRTNVWEDYHVLLTARRQYFICNLCTCNSQKKTSRTTHEGKKTSTTTK